MTIETVSIQEIPFDEEEAVPTAVEEVSTTSVEEVLFWDLETDTIKDFSEQSIRNALVTTFCGIFSPTGEEVRLVLPRNHTAEDDKAFHAGILQAMERADKTVAFNAFAFDLLCLEKTYGANVIARWCAKTSDPMVLIKAQNDGYPKGLNDLAIANGLQGKKMEGIEAPKKWRAGDHDELVEYCMHDVRILKALWELKEVTMPAKFKKYERTIRFASDAMGGRLGR